MKPPRITVHWLDNSRAQRILWLLEELGLYYEVEYYKRDPVTFGAPPELRKVHPLGKSPVVTIEEGDKKFTLAESGTIVEFIIERYGGGKLLVPAATGDPEQRADYLFWLHFAEGTMMSSRAVHRTLHFMAQKAPESQKDVMVNATDQMFEKGVLPGFLNNFKLIENFLEGKEYFGGSTLTGADIMMVYPIQILETVASFDDYPNTKAWLDRVSIRAAFVKALEKGGVNQPGLFAQWNKK
ncbi:glutathione S-transferase family protein [Meredithblackwellia eburnea MCA 4105]